MQLTLLIMTLTPALMLILGLAALALLLWAFWPDKGLVSLFERIRMNSRRVQLEDALKYMYDCEYRNAPCNINSIAGNLGISGDRAGHLLERLLSMGLITMKNQVISLTDTGRSYALRVVRVHRILERYLADETGVSPLDWHLEADRIEHRVSEEETEKLAAQMGNPVYDPHGDPIPSPEGKMPQPKGKPLSNLQEGDVGRIIHIEDEPKSIYEQLLVQGLYPGMQVYVTDVSDGKITFAANGDECILTPLFAGHINVELQAKKEPVAIRYDLLSTLGMGEKAEVVGISPNCRGQQRRRLMDLGIVPGSTIIPEIRSASGDPRGYKVMGTTIGIRKKQAEMVFINKLKDDNPADK